MPILSVYVSESQISALYYSSPKDFKFAAYPHVYPEALMHNGVNEDKFYQQVLKYFERKMGIDAGGCEVVIGTVNGRTLPLIRGEEKSTNTHSILKALKTVQNYSWLLVEDFFVGSKDGGLGFFPFNESKLQDSDTTTYFSNKSLYPQHQSTNSQHRFAQERLLKDIAAKLKYAPDTNKTLVFTGGRFSSMRDDPVSGYLLAFGLVNLPGVFRVKIDIGNKLPLISLLNMKLYGKDTHDADKKEQIASLGADITHVNKDEIFDDEFIDAGTLLKAPGGAEVLFEKEAGNSQFLELKRDQIFIFPLNVGETARVSISGGNLGQIEAHVRGGQLGFILDGRSYQYDSIDQNWIRVFKERVEAF